VPPHFAAEAASLRPDHGGRPDGSADVTPRRRRHPQAYESEEEPVTVTDSERDRVVRELRESYAAGALTYEQLNRRVDAALKASSSEELARLAPSDFSLGLTASPPDARRVERQLAPGERVEWMGKPDPSKHFTRGDVYLVPFSILWCGFAIFWEGAAIRGGGSVFFALWGVPFVLMGLYFVAGRFFHKAHRKRQTLYVVTNRRVLSIFSRRRGERVDSTYLRSIPSITTSADTEKVGSVSFGTAGPFRGWYGNTGVEFFSGGSEEGGATFYDIEEPRRVAELVERLREQER
jgi:hypothetical protein